MPTAQDAHYSDDGTDWPGLRADGVRERKRFVRFPAGASVRLDRILHLPTACCVEAWDHNDAGRPPQRPMARATGGRLVFNASAGTVARLPVARSFTNWMAEADLLDRLDRDSVETALQEAISNAVVHGSLELSAATGDGASEIGAFLEEVARQAATSPLGRRRIEVTAGGDADALSVDVRDQGTLFRTAMLAQRLLAADAQANAKPHGRGLAIMRALSDEIAIDDKDNRVTMVFRRRGSGRSGRI